MDEIVDIVFGDADAAHRAHLATESFAQHMALSEFYSKVRDAFDAFAEASIGLDMPPPTAEDMVAKLEDSIIQLANVRDDACGGSPILENLFDEVTGVYASALYKLKRLK